MRYAFLAVALLATATAFADCDQHGPQMDQIKQQLNLTDDQATQVEQILRSGHERMATMREAQHDDMRTQMESIHQDTLTQLRGILSEDQVQALEAQLKQQHAGGWHGHHAPDPATQDGSAT
jgi:hypothetical protein